MGQILFFGNQNGSFNIIEKVHDLDDEIKDQVLNHLKKFLHSAKSLTRSMGYKNISNKIHILEGTIFDFSLHKNLNEQIYEELWLVPLNELISESRNLFFNSSHFKALNLNA